jgi:predicted ATPase
LKEDAANLAPFLLRLRNDEPRYYRRITETIRLMLPFFADFELEPEHGKLLLRWRERDSDVVFSAAQAADGMLRAMALVSLLLQPESDLPNVLILDEPELGLHPYAVSIVAGLLRSASIQVQVVLATQSVTLINHFEPEEVVVVDRRDRESTFRRLDAKSLGEWLEEYSLAELWEKNVLGGRPG